MVEQTQFNNQELIMKLKIIVAAVLLAATATANADTINGTNTSGLGATTGAGGINQMSYGNAAYAASLPASVGNNYTIALMGQSLSNDAVAIAGTVNTPGIGGQTIGGTVNSSLGVAYGFNTLVDTGTAGYAGGWQGSVAMGAYSQATNALEFSIGSVAGGFTRTLSNVTAGVNNNDGVNVAQLNAAIAGVGGTGGTTDAIARSMATNAQTTADAATVSINNLTPRVATLETTVAGHTMQIANAQFTADNAQIMADGAAVLAINADTNASNAVVVANNADQKATSALNQIGGFNNRIGGLENRMNGLENGVANSMAMAASTSNAVAAAGRSERGIGFGIGASVFAGKQGTALSYAQNFNFGTASGAISSSGNIQIGAGWAF